MHAVDIPRIRDPVEAAPGLPAVSIHRFVSQFTGGRAQPVPDVIPGPPQGGKPGMYCAAFFVLPVPSQAGCFVNGLPESCGVHCGV